MNKEIYKFINETSPIVFHRKIPANIKNHLEQIYGNKLSVNNMLWCYMNIDPPLCPYCSSFRKFKSFTAGYKATCGCKECVNKQKSISRLKLEELNGSTIKEKRNRTKLERYGYKNYNNRDKFKKTCLERYGYETNLLSKETKIKIKRTKLERYNDENYRNFVKAKSTKLERYGDENYNNRDQVRETKLERYGDENYNNRDQAGRTSLERYENKNYVNPEKTKATKLERYGDKSYVNPEKAKKTNLELYGVSSVSRRHISKETLRKINSKEWLIDEHHNHQKSILQISKELKDIGDSTLGNYFSEHNIEIKHFFQSHPERLIIQHIEETYKTTVLTNIRSIIPPYEIDIYLPEYNLAIEYNGVYWHRPEVYGSKEEWFKYHQMKIDRCNEKDIQLLYIWEDYNESHQYIIEALNNNIDNDLNKVYIELYET